MSAIRSTQLRSRLIVVLGVTALAFAFAVLMPNSSDAAETQGQGSIPEQVGEAVQLAAGCDAHEVRSPAVSLGSPRVAATSVARRYDNCVVTGYTRHCTQWIDWLTGYTFEFCWYQPIVSCSD